MVAIFLFNSSMLWAFQAKPYDFPKPIDTTTKEVIVQERKVFSVKNGVSFDNTFKSASLGKLIESDSVYIIEVLPENEPINYSPWYAFKVWAKKDTVIHIIMDYGGNKYGQRYWPKLSADGKTWYKLPEKSLSQIDSTKVRLSLSITNKPLWVSAQEIQNSSMVINWTDAMQGFEHLEHKIAGRSKLDREVPVLEYFSKKANPTIVIMSRQHPPEVTGYLAMQAFVERIFSKDDDLSLNFLSQYNILIFPIINPDGVDLGHWRHNAGGVDLNRDWAYYNQPETRQVADYIVNFANEKSSKIVLGLDFHSTYKDIYYTNIDSLVSAMPEFTTDWIHNIKDRIEDSDAKIAPSGLGNPVSKAWFFTQFKAVGITYEIGDDTPRDLIKEKGEVSAEEMMKLLLKKIN